jgi:histidinol-phosphate phosphatase family protein
MLDLQKINKDWTLFLDRDGVLNHDKPDSYIFNPGEFRFYDGVLDSMEYFAKRFNHIILVTNQRGVGRGLMSEDALMEIHGDMIESIRAANGRIDQIFYCISTDNDHPNRKPNSGMAWLAKKEFPEIEFSRSIMVGNNLSDMKFGRGAGMFTVFLRTTIPNLGLPDADIDLVFDSLEEFAKALQNP